MLVHFGKGLTPVEPGSVDRLILTVKDIYAARADLISRGVEVSQMTSRAPSRKPPRGSIHQS
jgi:hypothetical protein